MLVQESGLPNAMLVQHLVLGVFAHLFVHFGGLLEQHLFLGRTLLLRLQATKPVLIQECWLQG